MIQNTETVPNCAHYVLDRNAKINDTEPCTITECLIVHIACQIRILNKIKGIPPPALENFMSVSGICLAELLTNTTAWVTYLRIYGTSPVKTVASCPVQIRSYHHQLNPLK